MAFNDSTTLGEIPHNHSGEAFGLEQFNDKYRPIHGYLSSLVCIFGIIFNSCNIYILTRKKMKNSATNILLTWIAVFDLITEAVYVPFAIHFHIVTDTDEEYGHTRPWVYYALVSLQTMGIAHTAAMLMTVALATFRCIYIQHHTKAQTLCSVERANLTTIIVSIVSIILCIPNFISHTVVDIAKEDNSTTIWIGETDLFTQSKFLQVFTFLVLGGIVKTGACIILLVFTVALLISLKQVKKRHDNLMQNSHSQHKQREHNRTTAMLSAVVLSFAIAELPQGILVLFSSADKWYFDHVYYYLGDLFDFVVLLNSSVNFIMYASMSQRFRDTFVDRVLSPVSKCVCRPWQKTKHAGENGEAAIPLQRNGKPTEAEIVTSGRRQRADDYTPLGFSMVETTTFNTLILSNTDAKDEALDTAET